MRCFTIYTDGSCPKPGGPGGWASVCLEDDSFTSAGHELETKNGRMELAAVVGGLDALPEKSIVTVVSDAQYVVLGFTVWKARWISNGWPSHVKNQDLWHEMIRAAERHLSVAFIHVRGHNKELAEEKLHHVPHNERADKLAGEQTLIAKEMLA